MRRHAAEVSAQLEAGGGLHPGEIDDYVGFLQGLLGYLVKQEADAPGWFKDEQTLTAALEALRTRQATVRTVLDRLQQPQTSP
jgi:hypothetical protein